MRKSSIALALLAAAAVVATTAFYVGGWQCYGLTCSREAGRIDAIEAHAELLDDGTLNVVEHVTFTFDRPQKLVHFDLPTLRREGGSWYREPIVVHTVRAESDLVLNHSENAFGRSLRVWLGDPKNSLTGTHTFLITYVVQGGVHPAGSRYALHWSPAGPDTRIPVKKIEADLTLPANIPIDDVSVACGATCTTRKQERSFHFSDASAFAVRADMPPDKVPAVAPQHASPLAPLLPFLPCAVVAAFALYALIRLAKDLQRS